MVQWGAEQSGFLAVPILSSAAFPRFHPGPSVRFVTRSHGGFFAVQQSKLGSRELTREDIEQIFRDPDSDEAQRLISSITRHTVQLRGTRPFWNRRRQDLEDMLITLDAQVHL